MRAKGGLRGLRDFKISSAPDGKFTGQGFSIDQGAPPIPMNSISLDGRTVNWKLDALGASYEGAFTADGNTINGTLTQGPNRMSLNLSRATPETAWAIPEAPPPPKPMDSTAIRVSKWLQSNLARSTREGAASAFKVVS